MATELPRAALEARYFAAAQEYLRKLPPEHFMEGIPQATQRIISVESFDLVHAMRPDVQFFNELLVQYPLPRRKRLGQVVPDNMVVIHSQPIKAVGSYDVALQPVRPFWMLEYVSKNNWRKDYDDNMRKYEHELKVPYYMLFVPDEQELTLYRHSGERYASVRPDANGRCAIPQLDLELGLLGGWVRYWYQGELLPLPADLQAALSTAIRRADTAERRADAAERELAQLRAQMEQMRSPPKKGA